MTTEKSQQQEQVDSVPMPDEIEQGALPESTAEINNLAEDEGALKDLLPKALPIISAALRRYRTLREPFETVWKNCDYMFKCGKNTAEQSTKEPSTSPPVSKTGSTIYWRQSTRLATQTLSVLLESDMPFKYRPIYSEGAFLKAEEGRILADQHNVLARWTMRRDNFEVKVMEGTTLLNKYGNLPVMVEWRHRKAMRKVKVVDRVIPDPTTGEVNVVGYRFEDREVVVENLPSLRFLANECLYADPNIGDMQKQNCIIIEGQTPGADLYDGQRSGVYANVAGLGASHLYKGEQNTDVKRTKDTNVGIDETDDTETGLYWQWDVFVRLPIADGKWDSAKNAPAWYWLTLIGDIENASSSDDPTSVRCVRFERNPDPDDMVRIMMWHQFRDDSERLYHISAAEVIESNFNELTTAKNQASDNRTLQNRKPLKAIRGEVYMDDLTFGRDKVFWLERQESLSEFQFADITNTIMANISYLEQDADRALQTVQAIEGMPMGGRTSASEAVNVYNQARMPHMMNARYQLMQLLPFYAEAIARYWHFYALPEQVCELTGEPENLEVRPAMLYGDYEVEVDVVERMERDQTALNALNYALQGIFANPAFMQAVDPAAALREWAALNKLHNPRWIRDTHNYDAERIARLENQMMVYGNQYDPPQPGEAHDTHLLQHKNFEAQFKYIENAESMYPGLRLLRQHIMATEQLKQQEAAMQMQQQMGAQGMMTPEAAPVPQTPGQEVGNEMAADLGASMGGRPAMATTE